MKTRMTRHPEYWPWLFSLLVWIALAKTQLAGPPETYARTETIYCMPGSVTYPTDSMTISHTLEDWILMVIAMMFPLLNEPVRHVAFSVRQRDRPAAILCFLIGYILIWTAVGALPVFFPPLITHNKLINATLFILAAISIWLPGRAIQLTKCSQTMPIRIQAWKLHVDSFQYGLITGVTCIKLCWLPMIAMALAHHNLALMYIVTLILIFERYLVPHTSKFSGYAWGALALALFGVF